MFDSKEEDNADVCFSLGRPRKLTLTSSIIIPYDAEVTRRVIQAWREEEREEEWEEGIYTI